MRKRLVLRLLLVASLVGCFVISCGKPSDSEIKTSVQKALEQRVPEDLAKYLLGGKKAVVEEIRIIEIGSAQGEGSSKYWPIKIYAKGTCVVMFGEKRGFEGQTIYNLHKDAFGEWVAEHGGIF